MRMWKKCKIDIPKVKIRKQQRNLNLRQASTQNHKEALHHRVRVQAGAQRLCLDAGLRDAAANAIQTRASLANERFSFATNRGNRSDPDLLCVR